MEPGEPREPIAVYMSLGDGKSDAFHLVLAEHLGGQTYRLLETEREGGNWMIPGATTVFAVEGDRPGMLVVAAPYVVADVAPEAKPGFDRSNLSVAVLRNALKICFAIAVTTIAIGWCFFRAPLPVHPADPLRLGVVVTGAVVLWWARKLEAVRFSRGVFALLSIPALLFTASIFVDAIFW